MSSPCEHMTLTRVIDKLGMMTTTKGVTVAPVIAVHYECAVCSRVFALLRDAWAVI